MGDESLGWGSPALYGKTRRAEDFNGLESRAGSVPLKTLILVMGSIYRTTPVPQKQTKTNKQTYVFLFILLDFWI